MKYTFGKTAALAEWEVPMRTTMLLLFTVTLVMLGGCGSKDAVQTIAREHKSKAAEMCKNDKGLKEVLDARGASFTAQCKSGIVVAGVANLAL